MQEITARSSKLLLMSAFLLGSLVTTSFVRAADATPPSEMQNGVPVYRVGSGSTATGGIGTYNGKITNQKDNNFTVGFTVSNDSAVTQPSVVYTIKILGKNEGRSIASQHTYSDDVMSLGVNQSTSKEISYVAPDYLKGTYSVSLELTSTDGAPLGASAIGDITLNGNGESIFVDGKSCFLSIDGVAGGKYPVQYGIDVSKDETLKAHCSIKNNFSKNVSVTPVFETHYRSITGKILGTEKQNVIALTSGQSMDFVSNIPKPTDPQAYDTVLTFIDATGKQISDPIDFHYVVQGPSATIQKVSTDKSSYGKGETATITVAWSGSADQFIGARLRNKNGVAQKTFLATSLSDMSTGQEVSCADGTMQTTDISKNGGVETAQMTMTGDCMNPVVSVALLDEAGNVLAQNKYPLAPADSKVATQPTSTSSLSAMNNSRTLWYVLGGLGILILLIYFMKRKKSVGMKMLLGLLLGVSMFVSGGDARASSFYIPVSNYWTTPEQYNQTLIQTGVGVTATDGDIKSTLFSPGKPITLSAGVAQYACSNAAGAKVTAIIDGQEQTLYDGTFTATGVAGEKLFSEKLTPVSFKASMTPGIYEVTLNLYQYILNFDQFGPCSSYIQTSINGPKVCGDTNGSTPHLINKVIYRYEVTGNRAPTIPIWSGDVGVNGRLAADLNKPYSFTFTSTDPDNDTLKYNVYNLNTGPWTADPLPAKGYVPSGTSQTLKKTFTNAPPYGFWVCAEDDKGLEGPCSSLYLDYNSGMVSVTATPKHQPGIAIVTNVKNPELRDVWGQAYGTVYPGDPIVFSFASKDDMGHKMKYTYNVTGPGQNGLVTVPPAPGLVPQEEQQFVTLYFPKTGVYHMYVNAEDELGNKAYWYTTTIIYVVDGKKTVKLGCSIQGQYADSITRLCACPNGQVVNTAANMCVPTDGQCSIDQFTANLKTGAYRCKSDQTKTPDPITGKCP